MQDNQDNKEVLVSVIKEIVYSIELILKRFENIQNSDDFLASDEGLEKLDSISMRLIAIGEGFKQVDRLTKNKLLQKYSKIPWKQVKGIRDILSHHYFNLDAEIIFEICKHEINDLLEVSQVIQDDLGKLSW